MTIKLIKVSSGPPVMRAGGAIASSLCSDQELRAFADRVCIEATPGNCLLDYADRGGMTPDEIAEVLNVTAQAVRQMIEKGLARMRRAEVFRY